MKSKELEAKKIFSENLRYFLSFNQKKQKDLAEYIGVSTGLVTDWCKGNKMPRVDKIKAMCDWFHIEMSDLLTEKPKHQEEGQYITEGTKRIANEIDGNTDLYALFEMCVEMPPQKLKALLEFIKLSI